MMKINKKLRIKALKRKIKRLEDYVSKQIGKTDPDTFWRHNSGRYVEEVDRSILDWEQILWELENDKS